MRWNREEYLSLMTGGGSDRPMFVEMFGPLLGLPEEWREQGATDDEVDMVAFNWDYLARIGCSAHTGAIGLGPTVTIEEDDEMLIQRDGMGRIMKLCKKTATIPLPMNFPVKTMDDWLALKHHYEFSEERINMDALLRAKELREQQHLVVAGIPGGFDTVRQLMGEEEGCVSYYSQPELIKDIMDTITDMSVKVLDRVTQVVAIDQLSVHEDMAGKSGPLIGPKQILECIKPYYRACWDLVSSRGAKLFAQDSDGDMTPALDAFIECGLNVTFPCEPAAGMDMVEIRKKYGEKLSMMGGIDKHVLRGTQEDIRKELEYKMQPMMQAGGVVFGLDHRIPNGTPIENYRYYVKTGREILGIPPLDASSRGWQRMAF